VTRVTNYEIGKSRGMRWAGLCNTHERMGNAHNLFGMCDGDEPVARFCVCVCVCACVRACVCGRIILKLTLKKSEGPDLCNSG